MKLYLPNLSNIAYNQSVVKLLDETVWEAILIQVCE